jgi:kinesin family protein 22
MTTATAATAAASSASSLQSVRVVLRVRPLLPSEASSAAAPCVSLVGSRPGGEVTVQLKDQHTRYPPLDSDKLFLS